MSGSNGRRPAGGDSPWRAGRSTRAPSTPMRRTPRSCRRGPGWTSARATSSRSVAGSCSRCARASRTWPTRTTGRRPAATRAPATSRWAPRAPWSCRPPSISSERRMTPRTIRAWSLVHKWSSLVCTAFMLLLCITGLPLVFHHEIGHWLGTEAEPPALAEDGPEIRRDEVMAAALARHPGLGGMFVSKEPDDDRVWYVTLAPTPRSHEGLRQVAVDARTGEVLAEPSLDSGFLHLMRSLHIDLFLGLPGMLFLGFMGLLLLVAIVSGVVLYAPFMRRLRFGEVRRDRSRRARWLDLHNLVGIVTVVWLFVVGATGVF